MSTVRATSAMPNFAAPGCSEAGPIALRIVVGAQLRRLREARGVSAKDAGEAIRASHSKISRMELGRNSFKRRDVSDLLTLYGVEEGAEREGLMDLANRANAPGWWHAFSEVVPSWFQSYLGLEQAATVIRCYEVQFVPGLLQTGEYARTIIRIGHHAADDAEIEQRVQLRMKRQHLLGREKPPAFWAVIDEAALRRVVGSSAIMRGQLQHLIDMSEAPHVTVQVVPFSVGGHAAAGGPITILRFPEDTIPDVVYLEQLGSAVYPDRRADLEHYWHVMNRLATEAEPPDTTTATLHRILEDL